MEVGYGLTEDDFLYNVKGDNNKNNPIKCIKQHSYNINSSDFNDLKNISYHFIKAKNYFGSRYSGITSISKINNHRKLIRDVLLKNEPETLDCFGLPRRYVKLALDYSTSNIKSNLSNTKNRIRDRIRYKDYFDKDDKHYCYSILSDNNKLYALLNNIDFELSDNIKQLKISSERQKYLNNYLKRTFRNEKGKAPYSNSHNYFIIDSGLYSYGYDLNENKPFIDISSLIPRKRIRVYLKEYTKFHGNLIVVLKDNTLEIHNAIHIKPKKKRKHRKKSKNRSKITRNISDVIEVKLTHVGGDKGYKHLISLSNGHFYGYHLSELLRDLSDFINDKMKNKHKFYSKYYELKNKLEDTNLSDLEKQELILKIRNIKTNSLGKKNFNDTVRVLKETIKTYINKELRLMFEIERISVLVLEDLTWTGNKDKPGWISRLLFSWCKGYIQERLEYLAQIYGVETKQVNAAYTSQYCSKCGSKGVRNGDVFICPNCGKMHADTNAAINIDNRLEDKEITVYTKYQKVKEILDDRYNKNMSLTCSCL